MFSRREFRNLEAGLAVFGQNRRVGFSRREFRNLEADCLLFCSGVWGAFSRREFRNLEAAVKCLSMNCQSLSSVGANSEILRRRLRSSCRQPGFWFSRREFRNLEAGDGCGDSKGGCNVQSARIQKS